MTPIKRNIEFVLISALLLVICASLVLFSTLAAKELGWLEWPVNRATHEEQASIHEIDDNSSPDIIFPSKVRTTQGNSNLTLLLPFNKNAEPKRFIDESERDKLDIYAQEGMWKSANFLVLLTLIQVLVGTFTLYFLMGTFGTQRKELEEARKHTVAQRAYMLWDGESLPPRFATEDDVLLTVVSSNTGQTPALNVTGARGHSVIDITSTDFSVDVNVDEFNLQTCHVAAGSQYSTEIHVHEKGIANALKDGEVAIIIGIIIDYNDVFEARNDIREFSYRFSISASGTHPETGDKHHWFSLKPMTPAISQVNKGIPKVISLKFSDNPV